MSAHVEAEVKYAITEQQYKDFPKQLRFLGWSDVGVVSQEDHYVTFESSTLGGFDFLRLRKQVSGGVNTYFWTKKYHGKDHEGNKMRFEDERETTAEEYATTVSQTPGTYPVIKKQRHNFTGTIETWPATISLDVVDFGAAKKYFIEAEILATEADGARAKKSCKQWLSKHLDVDVTKKASSYLKQYLAAEHEEA